MPFVLDSSVSMAWVFADEGNDYTESVRNRLGQDSAVVASIWPVEMANAVVSGERRGRIADPLVDLIGRYAIEVESHSLAQTWGPVMTLARAQHLTAYDAWYLEIALRRGLELATQDGDLRAAAVRIGVRLLP